MEKPLKHQRRLKVRCDKLVLMLFADRKCAVYANNLIGPYGQIFQCKIVILFSDPTVITFVLNAH